MKNLVSVILIFILFVSCSKMEEKKQYSEEEVKKESLKANVFFDKVFDSYIDRHPMDQSYLGIKKDQDKWNDISDEHEAKELEIVKENLAKMRNEIVFDKLDDQTKLSYRLYEYNASQRIEGSNWRYYNYPVNQLFGLHSEAPSFLINIHQISDATDAKAYIARIKGIGPMFDRLIKNMQTRVAMGICPPKFVFEQVLNDCRSILAGYPIQKVKVNNSIYEDFSAKVNSLAIGQKEKEELIGECTKALTGDLQSAYQKLIIYLTNLEQTATNEDGAWKFPKGGEFYRHALKVTTTTNMSPEEIYDLGLKEVARIHSEMKGIMKQVNFKNDQLQDFFKFIKEDKQFYYSNDAVGKKTYLERTNQIIDSMRLKLDELFITKPKAKLIVKAVEPFREKSTAGAFYQEPAPDGSRPGIYYANLYDMSAMPTYEMEALAYHEAIPGHHMQLSIAQELQGIPKFRRLGGNYTAYIEGWGLYNELTPKEMGFYQNPYSDFGRLSMELLRACRLVVDVGIHEKKWTREQAVKYFKDNTPNSDVDCQREIDRYIVWPSQATAYKVGMIKIMKFRENARKELGDKFNIREFHDVVLKYGALPLDILEENVNVWVKSKLNK